MDSSQTLYSFWQLSRRYVMNANLKRAKFFVILGRKMQDALVDKAKLVHKFSYYVYFFPLRVSGDWVPIIRRNNCVYAKIGTCYSVWMIVWYAGWN
jgi:hypothetical protein